MSVTVWRIGTDTLDYTSDDLSGEGARRSGGRWNARGVAAVYTSQSRALACLETVVHLDAGGLPFNRYLVAVTIPDEVWAKAEKAEPAGLPIGWDSQPPGLVSVNVGTEWLRSGRCALMIVPSTIVPEEGNVIINPAHEDSRAIHAAKVRRWTYDPRLSRSR